MGMIRREKGDPDALVSSGLKESCLRISSLVYYIVKNKYGIQNKNSKVFHCIFTLTRLDNSLWMVSLLSI